MRCDSPTIVDLGLQHWDNVCVDLIGGNIAVIRNRVRAKLHLFYQDIIEICQLHGREKTLKHQSPTQPKGIMDVRETSVDITT
jgi:hypothetical protein